MKFIIKLLSFLGLALTIIPVFFVLNGSIGDDTYKNLMLAGTLIWFFTAPFWIFNKKADENI